ncbi:NAD(P)-binding protein [Xylaria intraflava]|nr:NAD(P)-binding protein [Xylaria intraflava]
MALALIIGAGPVVGKATAETFTAAGYKVAVAARTQRLDPSYPFFQFDATEPTQVPAFFQKVREAVGIPSVVVYNAYGSGSSIRGPGFDIDSIEAFQARMNANGITPTIVAKEAVDGFLELESQGKLAAGGGTFLLTGNILNETPLPGFFSLGLGKSTSAALIKYLALTSYNDKPFSFYYVDERHADGSPMYQGTTGPAHAKEFLKLAQDPKQGPWQHTFSKENGYEVFTDAWLSKAK